MLHGTLGRHLHAGSGICALPIRLRFRTELLLKDAAVEHLALKHFAGDLRIHACIVPGILAMIKPHDAPIDIVEASLPCGREHIFHMITITTLCELIQMAEQLVTLQHRVVQPITDLLPRIVRDGIHGSAWRPHST